MKVLSAINDYLIPRPLTDVKVKKNTTDVEEAISTNKSPKASISKSNNTPIYGIPSILDSVIRGIGRYYETLIDNYFNRVGFRFVTELLRYTSSRSLLNLFLKNKFDSNLLKVALKKSLEITIGTAIIDPNKEEKRTKRMGEGFLNMVSRLGARVGLVGLGLLDKKQFSFKPLIDEFLSRTLCRVLYLKSENPILGIGCRTVEQFAINEWVRNMPFYNIFLGNLISSNKSKDTEN